MKLQEIYKFKELPFIFRTHYAPHNDKLPDRLPFILGVDLEANRLVQIPSLKVRKALDRAYKLGSFLTGYMSEDGIGRSYAEDFLKFLISTVGLKKIASSRILEIGCGTGYLLSRLKKIGAEVLGVEPGPQGREGQKRYGVRIVRDFFPSAKISGLFDIIIQYDVVEHLENPVGLLSVEKKYLKSGGCVFIASPACDDSIESGDISFLLHEHFSYFSRETLRRTIELAGFSVLGVNKANFGGAWYVIAKTGRKSSYAGHPGITWDGSGFVKKMLWNQNIFDDFLGVAASKNKNLGFYCPSRILNNLALAESRLKKMPVIRFFDDNELLHGCYYASFPYPVELRKQLLQKPVDILFIASRTFGRKIRQSLIVEGYKGRIIGFQNVSQKLTA